jgi:sugar phosphate isomerase/epimerase
VTVTSDPATGKTLADTTLSFHSLGETLPAARAAAASAAGFRRLGLSIRRTRAWLADHPLGELTDLLDEHGLVVGELEALAPMRAAPDQHAEFALELARVLDCPVIQLIGPYEGTEDDAVARLSDLAQLFTGEGRRLSLEFLPWTNIPSASAASGLLTRVGEPGIGMCVDLWHLYRSGGAPADLGALWPQVVSIQLDDGPLVPYVPDLFTDCIHHRRLPGDGEFDLVTVLAQAARYAPGYSLSIEVLSDQLKGRPVDEVALRLAASVRTTLDAVAQVPHAAP